MQRTSVRTVLAVTGMLACPCFFVPLALAVFGGTIIGGWLSSHIGVVAGLATAYVIVALGLTIAWVMQAAPSNTEKETPNDAVHG